MKPEPLKNKKDKLTYYVNGKKAGHYFHYHEKNIKSAVEWFKKQEFVQDTLSISKCPKCKDNSISLKREKDNHCIECVLNEAFEDVTK